MLTKYGLPLLRVLDAWWLQHVTRMRLLFDGEDLFDDCEHT